MTFLNSASPLKDLKEDDPFFKLKFLDWLKSQPTALPLEKYCEEGWPSKTVQFYIEEYQFNPDFIEVKFCALFDECISACCHLGSEIEEDGFYTIPRRGDFICIIDRKHGHSQFKPTE
ncbi:hypothetical protein EM20IM_06855 [Candidatus Methylacidiphilum infernorum]|uniref:Uncharacterized protein n=1 Tax=Candidatus Methylacidiphilum infernorum TaxID=511746 RepID=A0ABX7PTH0_9BACT|nr:hypothetical protein [Candidatus Methylacidiphilum infernorum]QSR86222.1 hypothetical protein EM20IM_06855 [Candidatus Methylacidiphilum infernorum]